MKIIIIILFILFPFFTFADEFKLICKTKNKLNNKDLSNRFSKVINLEDKTVENISGNYFDKLVIFNEREIIMQNRVFNTSSSFNIRLNQWTAFNENFIDVYLCKKKRY